MITFETEEETKLKRRGWDKTPELLTRPASKNSHSVSMSVGASLPVTQYFADKLLSISLSRVAQADAPFSPLCFARRPTTSSALWDVIGLVSFKYWMVVTQGYHRITILCYCSLLWYAKTGQW